ncbi:sorting nexin-22-like [Watersipora subatra]|uniref:sorting nexin-22-like n=1 Tax=Watersipora subatra TaxID=2589382 RepID=UPI00355B1431
MLVKAFLAGYRTVHDDIGSMSYTVFVIDVYVDGLKHVVERRYSEFEDLHKILKKQMTVPIFPPKKLLNKSSKFIEERRIQLEAYIQDILFSAEHMSELAKFLGLSDSVSSASCIADSANDTNSRTESPSPQTDVQLSMCPFSKSSDSCDENFHSREVSPDIVLQGIYQALYAT